MGWRRCPMLNPSIGESTLIAALSRRDLHPVEPVRRERGGGVREAQGGAWTVGDDGTGDVGPCAGDHGIAVLELIRCAKNAGDGHDGVGDVGLEGGNGVGRGDWNGKFVDATEIVQVCAAERGAVKVAVDALHQSAGFGGKLSVDAVEIIQHIEHAAGGDHEQHPDPAVAGAAVKCCAVKIAVTGLHDALLGIVAVGVIELVQRRDRTGGRHLENGPASAKIGAAGGGAVKIAVTTPGQRAKGTGTFAARAEELVQRRQRAGGRDEKGGALMVGAAVLGNTVKIAVAALDESGPGIGPLRAPAELVQDGERAVEVN